MTRCQIKSGIWCLFNNVSFVEIDGDNVIKFGYLMFDNDISHKSKEYICNSFKCQSRLDALKFALIYNYKCANLSANFADVESYIYDTARTLENVQSITA
ncbi:hypothetical protein [Vreelandella sulfidaeris]